MTDLAPGTPCFFVGLTERSQLIGRVVEIVSLATVPDMAGDWYRVYAGWLDQEFAGRDVLVGRSNLLPIIPPSLAPSARKRAPEKIGQ